MKPGRAFSLLTGVALLGAIARFNEMTPDAQASLLGAAAKTARTTAESLLHGAVESYNGMTAPEPAAPPSAAPQSAAPQPTAPQPAASQPATSQPAAPQPRAAAPPPPAEEGKESAPPRQVAALTARAVEPEVPSGNPLWTLPLKQLSMTRDRPIFSPSRRPPPPKQTLVAPVAVRQVKPAEPERPTVSLLGTIIGSKADDQIGVFIDSATQSVIRLRVGEDHEGWVLRIVKARQATLVKDGEVAVVLDLPAPGEGGVTGFGSIPPPGGIMAPGGGAAPNPGVVLNPNIPNPAVQAQARQQYQQQMQQRRQR